LESRKKLAEIKLAQMKLAEENRDANQKAKIEKLKCDIEKVKLYVKLQNHHENLNNITCFLW